MKRLIVLLVLLLAATATTQAQDDDCGNGLPCGRIPWQLPGLPPLESPTPMPTISITATPDGNANPPTSTPAPTATATTDVSTIDASITEAIELVERTPEVVIGLDGMQADLTSIEASAEVNLFFSYARGLGTVSFGVFTPLVTLLLTFFLISIVIYGLTFILPIVGVIVGFIRRVLSLVLEFIPF